MPTKWDDASEKQMLLALMHIQPPLRANWAQVADMLGEDFSAEALRQKYMKMKKAATAQWGEVEAQAKTPLKGGGKKVAGEKSSGKRKAVEERDGGEESPVKKKKTKVQEESEDEV